MQSCDGNGGVTRFQLANNYHRGLFESIWSDDYGVTWKNFMIGSPAGDDGLVGIEFFHNADGLCIRFLKDPIDAYDLYFSETEIFLQHTSDGVLWKRIWTLPVA